MRVALVRLRVALERLRVALERPRVALVRTRVTPGVSAGVDAGVGAGVAVGVGADVGAGLAEDINAGILASSASSWWSSCRAEDSLKSEDTRAASTTTGDMKHPMRKKDSAKHMICGWSSIESVNSRPGK